MQVSSKKYGNVCWVIGALGEDEDRQIGCEEKRTVGAYVDRREVLGRLKSYGKQKVGKFAFLLMEEVISKKYHSENNISDTDDGF